MDRTRKTTGRRTTADRDGDASSSSEPHKQQRLTSYFHSNRGVVRPPQAPIVPPRRQNTVRRVSNTAPVANGIASFFPRIIELSAGDDNDQSQDITHPESSDITMNDEIQNHRVSPSHDMSGDDDRVSVGGVDDHASVGDDDRVPVGEDDHASVGDEDRVPAGEDNDTSSEDPTQPSNINKPFTIVWKGEEFCITTPRLTDLATCLDRIKKLLSKCFRSVSFGEKFERLEPVLIRFVEENYHRIRFNPQSLKFSKRAVPLKINDDEDDGQVDEDGIYTSILVTLGLYLLKKSMQDGGGHKIGMSLNCNIRARNQICQYAYRLMGKEELDDTVPDEIVIAINNIRLPALQYHPDHDVERDCEVRMQAVEMLLTRCTVGCTNKIVLERILWTPSQRVVDAITPATIPDKPLQILRERPIPNGGVHCALTWSTLISYLRRILQEFLSSPTLPDWLDERPTWLEKLLHPEPKEGGFVTMNRLKVLVPEKKMGMCQDSMPRPPRCDDLDPVCIRLRELLSDPTDPSKEDLQEALSPLMGDNYSSFVPPKKGELAPGLEEFMDKVFATPPDDNMFMVERCHIQDYADSSEANRKRLKSLIPHWDDPDYDIIPEDPMACRLVKAETGHRVLIHSSYHVMFAESTCVETHVFPALKSYSTAFEIFRGDDKEYCQDQRAILMSFAMTCDDLDMSMEDGQDTFKKARRLAVANGFFRCHAVARVLSVSINVGIGYAELLYIRLILGKVLFQKFLRCLGFATMQDSNPLEEDFYCPGIPASEELNLKPPPCKLNKARFSENNDCYICMIGAKQPDHSMRGHWVCMPCYRNHYANLHDELTIKMRQKKGLPISDDQKARLVKYEEWRQKKRDWAARRREEEIAQGGEYAVRDRLNPTHRARDTNNIIEGVVRPPHPGRSGTSGEKRVVRDPGATYPPFFHRLMRQATLIFIDECGQHHLFKNFMYNLFDRLIEIVDEHPPEGEELGPYLSPVPRTDSGKVMYIMSEYLDVLHEFCHPAEAAHKRSLIIKNGYKKSNAYIKVQLNRRRDIDVEWRNQMKAQHVGNWNRFKINEGFIRHIAKKAVWWVDLE